MKLFIYITFLVSICLYSCRKHEDNDTKGPHCSSQPIRYIDPEIKKFKFKMGSYWVFVDPNYPIIDTMRISSIIVDDITDDQYCPDNKYERYAFSVFSSYYTLSNTQYYYLSDSRLILNPNSSYRTQSGIYTTSSPKIDSVFIYDRYYKSVVTYKINNNKYYINADFGFLKLEVLDNVGNVISQKLLKDKFIVR
jgi:hypothetical protein